jgi:UPF0755 protein
MIKRIKFLIIILITLLFLTGAYLLWIMFFPQWGDFEGKTQVVRIKSGCTFNEIVAILTKKGVITSPRNFILTAKIFDYTHKLKAGKYHIPLGLSNYSILKILVKGEVSTEWVTVPEGFNSRQIASILRRKIEIDSSRFVTLVNDSVFAKALGINASSLEGYLYPETYNLHWGIKEEAVIRILVKEFNEHFTDFLRIRAQQLGFTPHQALTLASIIEGEAVVDSERAVISAVYHNRLKKGIPLQADPTIQYIIEDGPRRLLDHDLEIDSPYNTYKYPGLPPGPVNNPGIKSIRAALYPAPVNYLYFVAYGDGSHVFSTNLGEHLRAKRKFDKLRRAIEQKRKKGGVNEGI